MLKPCVCMAICAGLCAGCAHISAERYDKVDGAWEWQGEGFEAYRAHPYLLVKHTGNAEKPIEVETLNLPDFDHLTVIEQIPGIGNSTMALTFDGSMLSAVTNTQDSQLDELLAAAAAAATPFAALAGTRATADATRSAADSTALATIVNTALGKLPTLQITDRDALRTCGTVSTPQWVTDVKAEVDSGVRPADDPKARKAAIWASLAELAALLTKTPEDSSEVCRGLKDVMDRLVALETSNAGEVARYMGRIEAIEFQVKDYANVAELQKPLNVVKTLLSSFLKARKLADPPFELFRIETAGDTTTLVRVKLPPREPEAAQE